MTSRSQKAPARTTRFVGLAGAVGIGVVLAVQSRINGTLGARLGDGVATALISFGLGLVVLLGATALMPTARRGLAKVLAALRGGGGLRLWQCLGGVCGAFLVFSQGVTVAVLGVALFTVSVVSGQVTSGLLVDRLGLGPAVAQRVTIPRFLGAGLAVAAVAVAVSAELGGANPSWLVLLPAIAGVGTAWQQAVNGRVKEVADSPVSAATLNFAVGTAALLIAFVGHSAVAGLPAALPADPWLYVGGPMGIIVIGGAAALVRHTGVLLLSMGMVAGQLTGALLLDLLLPTPGTNVEHTTVIGAVLTFAAVAIAAMPTRRHRSVRTRNIQDSTHLPG